MFRKSAIAGAVALLYSMMFHASIASGAAKRGVNDACSAATVLAASDDGLAGMSGAIVCLVNRERANRGLTAVRLSQQLSRSATVHSEDMAKRKFFAHVGPGGINLRQRVDRSGYLRGSRSNYIGETLAWGSEELGTPAELVRSLMASPGHKRILLDGRFRDVGVGLASAAPVADVGGNGVTLTLDFGRR